MLADEADEIDAEDFTDAAATFGDRLAHAREAMALEQAQLAHRLGVKLQTLHNWEEDRSEPRANKLQMLAGMLNVSMVWLMSGQGEAPQRGVSSEPDSTAHACLAELRNLRGEQLRLTERMARLEKRLRVVLGQGLG